MGLIRAVRDEMLETAAEREALRGWAAQLYAGRYRRLGLAARRNEDGESGLCRQQVVGFLARTAREPRVRRELADRGRSYIGFGGDGAAGASA